MTKLVLVQRMAVTASVKSKIIKDMSKNEHLIVSLLEPVKPGEAFVDWPLHMTIVPWFSVKEIDKNILDEVLVGVANRHKTINAKVGQIAMFGTNLDVPVNTIKTNKKIDSLHKDMFGTLEVNYFPIHHKDICWNNYRPHITIQGEKAIIEGTEIVIANFALIKQIRQKGSGVMEKQLIKEYKLR